MTDEEDPLYAVQQAVSNMTEETAYGDVVYDAPLVFYNNGGTYRRKKRGFEETPEPEYDEVESPTITESVTREMRALGDNMKRALSSNKVLATLGFAGAIMAAGYIGGNPGVSPEGQSQGIQRPSP